MTDPYAVSGPVHVDRRPVAHSPGPVHLEEPDCCRAVLSFVEEATSNRPFMVVLGPETYEVTLASPEEAVWPFTQTETGSWRLDHAALAARAPRPSPATRRSGLVTVARSDISRSLLDLVACGSVTLEGPPVAVGATLCDVIVELASRRWCDLEEVVVVGFGDDIATIEGVVCLPDVPAAHRHLLAETPRARCFVIAPCTGPDRQRREEELSRLIGFTRTAPDTAVVTCEADAPTRVLWRLKAHRETLDIAELASSGRRAVFRAPRASGLTQRVESAAGPAALLATPAQLPSLARVIVRVLGQVDVVGSAAPITHRPRVTELVTYLALHQEGCTGDAIASAVWPRKRVPAQTLANRLSEARRALGLTEDGTPRLQRRHGRHVLSDDVMTDLALFEQTAMDRGRRGLEAALSLVRGRPLEGLHDSGWTLLEGFVSDAESAVVTAAARLGELSLLENEPSAAVWAVRRGLLASPWDEGLYRLLMRAHHAAGNTGGVDAALRGLARALEWTGAPLDGVHPETARLYRSLVGRRTG